MIFNINSTRGHTGSLLVVAICMKTDRQRAVGIYVLYWFYGLEKTLMEGTVAGKRSRVKPRQRWEKDIRDTFGTMAAASIVAEDRHQFRRNIWAATS